MNIDWDNIKINRDGSMEFEPILTDDEIHHMSKNEVYSIGGITRESLLELFEKYPPELYNISLQGSETTDGEGYITIKVIERVKV